MEKLKLYLKSSIKQDVEANFRKVYGDAWEKAFEFFYPLSEHKLDSLGSSIRKIRLLKYHKVRKRLLGTKTKAMPDSILSQLLDFYSSDDRIHLAINFQSYEGLRINDEMHLKLPQIDLEQGIVHCYNHKVDRWYDVPIDKHVEAELRAYLDKYMPQIKEHHDYVFFTNAVVSSHEHWSQQYVNRKIVEALKELKLEKIYAISKSGHNLNLFTSHSDRGHAGTYILRKTNGDYRAMQMILDHMPESLSSTLLYEETDENRLVKVMRD